MMDQQAYDAQVEALRGAVNQLMTIGIDDPNGTADDIENIVKRCIEDSLEDIDS